MDEIEWKRTYNEAVSAAEKIIDPAHKRSVLLELQLINALNERLIELQDSMEDE